MARSRKRKSKFKRHMYLHRQTYMTVSLVAAALVLVLWLANFLVKEEGKHVQVVKALKGTPEQRYKGALNLVAEGDIKQARVVMFRLARLSESVDRPLGHGKAHLWVASDKLTHFDPDFIWKFPGLDDRSGSKIVLPRDEKTLTVQNHLAHAVGLNPELEKAITLWVATLVAQGERNRAVEILMKAIAHPEVPHPGLHVPLVHILAMEGNDLELKQATLHMFTTLGRRARYSRGKDISDKISYVISALMLQRYEIANVTIQVLEARLPKAGGRDLDLMDAEDELFVRQVRALRMAYHYHRAVAGFREAKSAGSTDYGDVVDELELVVKVSPDCDSAIAALSFIADKDANQTARIKGILEGVLSMAQAKDSQAKSRVNMSLAKLEPGAKEDHRKLLEDAVASDPKNGEAILSLSKLLLSEDAPDYPRVEKLATKALKNCDPLYRPDLYHQLGEVQVRTKNWSKAVIFLEKALRGTSQKQKVHALLAEAYAALGDKGIAEEHKKLAAIQSKE